MFCLFYMIRVDIRYIPNIRGIFAEGVSTKLPFVWTFVRSFPRILLRDTYIIKIEDILFALRKP